MATCPECGDYLDADHHCLGAWRRIGIATVVAAVGGTGVVVALYGFMDRPAPALVMVAAVLGAVLARALWHVGS